MNLFTLYAKMVMDTSEYEKSVAEAGTQAQDFKEKLTDVKKAAESSGTAINKSLKSASEYASDKMKLANQYINEGLDRSSALKKASQDIDKSLYDIGKGSKRIKEVGDAAEEAEESFGGLNQKISVLKDILAADIVKKAANVMVQFASDSIEVASSLSEVQNVVDVTFGSDSGKIDRWAKSANSSFGLTELQAKKFTSTLGAMMKSSGLAGDAVTEMSINLSGLAADMASFYNLDYDQAFEKIRAGISGETEPLKQLGINMSVANLEAYAMTQGITKAYESMSQGEQVQLRYNYLMQATADAQGDFARTSDGYANSIRTLQGNIETLKGKLGEIMIPLLEEAAGLGNQLLSALVPEATLSETIEEIKTDYSDKLKDITDTQENVSFLVGELEKLGDRAGLTADEQERWQAICSKLVETLPSLSSIINTQTGEIRGGTAAVMEYTQAWADAAKQDALTAALQDVESARAEAMTKAAKAQVDLETAEAKLNRLYAERKSILEQISEQTGLSVDSLEMALAGTPYAPLTAHEAGSEELAEAYSRLASEILETETAQKTLERENEKAQTDMENGLAAIEQTEEAMRVLNVQYSVGAELTYEEAKQIADLTDLYGEFEDAYASLEEQVKEAETYRAAMLESTRADIEKTVSGFQGIGLDKLAEDFKENIGTMVFGLEDQARFMDEYAENLKSAAEKGVNEGLLATLSDGSKESALYLREIVTGNENNIAALNASWEKVQEGKETFAQVLSDQKLTVDEEYNEIIQKTDEMVANLDQKTTAYENAANTASGIAEGLLSKMPEIDAANAAINSRLASLGVVSRVWTLGAIPTVTTEASGFSTSHNAHGLDYVPTNDYPAWLHKGEAVLTSNEAEAWRAIQSEPRESVGIDLNALAGVIVSAMSGVTLQMDRRTVGQVVAPVVSEEIAREARMRRYDL